MDKDAGWKQSLVLVAVPPAPDGGSENDPVIKQLSQERDAILADVAELRAIRTANGGGAGDCSSSTTNLQELKAMRQANT